MHRIIRVVFVKSPNGGTSEELRKKQYEYICNDNNLVVGDVFTAVGYTNYLQIVSEEYSSRTIAKDGCYGVSINLKEVRVGEITLKSNKETINKNSKTQVSKMNKSSMLSGISEKFKSMFLPEKETDVRMSLEGTLCVNTGNNGWIGIKKGGELVSYPEEMTIEVPVYSINKPQNKVQAGDIIKNGRYSYAKVLEVKENGQLRVLSYSGYTQNKKEIKDFVMGQSMVRVVINMFNFDSNDGGFNPMMLALAGDGDIDAKTLMLMQMMPGTKGTMQGMNPMMFLLLDKENNSSDMLSTMCLMQMMQSDNNPFKMN